MLEFRQTMDPHALDVFRDGKMCASLQWHKERSPRVILRGTDHLSLDEMKAATRKLTEYFLMERCQLTTAAMPSQLVLSPVNAEPLLAAGFIAIVAHEPSTGTIYRATHAGSQAAASPR